MSELFASDGTTVLRRTEHTWQHYTNRGQQFDTRVSTIDDGSWNRGAIINYY